MIDTKKIKARITKKVHCYAYEGKRYFPGDIVEIPESLFKAHFMEKVEPAPQPTKKATPTKDETKKPEPPTGGDKTDDKTEGDKKSAKTTTSKK